jgi:alpha-galactosidase
MRLVRLKDRLVLGLPDRGMPVIVSCFAADGSPDEGWENAIHRAGRVNGMDIAAPSSVFLPVGGMGFFGWPAIQGHRNGQHPVLDLGNWQVTTTPKGLVLAGEDQAAGIALQLVIEAGEGGLLQMRTVLTNRGESPYTLERCMAGSILVRGGAARVSRMGAGWGREFQITHEALGKSLWLQENRRGRTSHDHFPGLAIRAGSDVLYGIHVGWSGNHVMAIDRLDDGQSLVHGGELFEPGEMILEPGAHYESPTLYAGCTTDGDAEKLWPAFHRLLREEILKWPGGRMTPRPVLLNTWEGVYFAHDLEKLKAQAIAAAQLGVERFVLDDGWFGRRDDDTSSLGDWFIDERKYPHGLTPLIDHVTSRGMEFGIWVEPEMVNPNSDLYRAHPGWVLQAEGKPLLLSRHQLVLDLTRREVFDYLAGRLDWLLSSHAISYLKWDMNRDLTHAVGHDGRAAVARQTRAAYALMDHVRAAHPDVEIESCASGGGRADYGVLQRTHRVWVSDCTDALERLEIQRGASRFLAPAIMGCHISASPNHQTHRRHALSFRAIVAFFGHLGIELDPTKLTAEERQELQEWIALHKKLRPVLHDPASHFFHRAPVDGRHVFGVRLADGDQPGERFIMGVAQATQPMREQPEPLSIPVAWRDDRYAIELLGPVAPDFVRATKIQRELLGGGVMAGNWLAARGLPIPQLHPESAILLEIKTLGVAHG